MSAAVVIAVLGNSTFAIRSRIIFFFGFLCFHWKYNLSLEFGIGAMAACLLARQENQVRFLDAVFIFFSNFRYNAKCTGGENWLL